MRLLWLYGPPGAGKSVTAWEVLNTLAATGETPAYVDIDQLGMLYPAPADDPAAEELKARGLAAVADGFAQHGATTLVVSGVLDPGLMSYYRAELGSFALGFVRLTVDEVELKRRVDARGVHPEDWAEVLAHARALVDAGLDHPVVVADGRSPADVARAVLDRAAWIQPEETGRARSRSVPVEGETSEAVLVTGTRAVGKSTVAWAAFMTARRAGVPTAFIDLRQLGFLGLGGGPIDHRLQAAAVEVLWGGFRAAGARLLLLNGRVDDPRQVELYRRALHGTPLECYRLTADEDTLTARIRARSRGEGPRLAGDGLVGLSPDDTSEVVTRALREQQRAPAAPTMQDVDTSTLTIEAAGRALLQHHP